MRQANIALAFLVAFASITADGDDTCWTTSGLQFEGYLIYSSIGKSFKQGLLNRKFERIAGNLFVYIFFYFSFNIYMNLFNICFLCSSIIFFGNGVVFFYKKINYICYFISFYFSFFNHLSIFIFFLS